LVFQRFAGRAGGAQEASKSETRKTESEHIAPATAGRAKRKNPKKTPTMNAVERLGSSLGAMTPRVDRGFVFSASMRPCVGRPYKGDKRNVEAVLRLRGPARKSRLSISAKEKAAGRFAQNYTLKPTRSSLVANPPTRAG